MYASLYTHVHIHLSLCIYEKCKHTQLYVSRGSLEGHTGTGSRGCFWERKHAEEEREWEGYTFTQFTFYVPVFPVNILNLHSLGLQCLDTKILSLNGSPTMA